MDNAVVELVLVAAIALNVRTFHGEIRSHLTDANVSIFFLYENLKNNIHYLITTNRAYIQFFNKTCGRFLVKIQQRRFLG